jgi:hypothetical protein
MQLVLAAALLISLGVLLLYQFRAHSFDDCERRGDAVGTDTSPAPLSDVLWGCRLGLRSSYPKILRWRSE